LSHTIAVIEPPRYSSEKLHEKVGAQKKLKEPSRICDIGRCLVTEKDFNGFRVSVGNGCNQRCNTTGRLDIRIRPMVEQDLQNTILIVLNGIVWQDAGVRRGSKRRIRALLKQIENLGFISILNSMKKGHLKIKETSVGEGGLGSGER
jgi:hypothetical protein